MNRRSCFAIIVGLFIGAGFGAEWMNVVPESRVGGRMASCGYLKGKVVLLDVRDYSDDGDAESMKKIQDVWTAYKSKPFVALGSHIGPGDRTAAGNLIKTLHLTYSIYSDVAIKDNGAGVRLPRGIYVFDSTGKRLYFGGDPRQAMGIVGNAIFAECIPPSLENWKSVLDYEISALPGQAYLRIRDLKTNHKDVLKRLSDRYPEDVKRYAKTWRRYGGNSEVRKLAKLVETTRLIKDRDKTSTKARGLRATMLESIIRQYSGLAKSENPLIAQEAKNSIADLKFVQAELGR